MRTLKLLSRQFIDNTSYTKQHLKRELVVLLIISIVFSSFMNIEVAKADANSSVNYRLDFLEEIAVVTAGTGQSTKFYMSTDGKKTWEMIDASGVVDLSSILTTKAISIYFKGNKDMNPIEVKLPEEDKSLKVAYKIANGDGHIEIPTTVAVEYRKGPNGVWKTATNMMSTSIYEIKGTTLFFRTVATTVKRSGKIVSVKIGKKPAGPSVKIDGSKLSITGLKVGVTQYRVGDSTNWSTFTSGDSRAKSIDLRTLMAPTSAVNTAIPAGFVEFRTLGTTKKLTSSVKVIDIPTQAVAPEVASISGSAITVSDTNLKKLYEYTVVKKSSITVDLNTAKWIQITPNKTVIVSNVEVGDKVLVRAKTSTDPVTKQIILPSLYKELTVASITK